MKYQINSVGYLPVFSYIKLLSKMIFNQLNNILDGSEPAMIKSALVEIMKSTCIKLVPRRKKEDDYIVFMEYKALSQPRGFVFLILLTKSHY